MWTSSLRQSLGHPGQELRGGVPRPQVRHQLRRLRPQQQVHSLGECRGPEACVVLAVETEEHGRSYQDYSVSNVSCLIRRTGVVSRITSIAQ